MFVGFYFSRKCNDVLDLYLPDTDVQELTHMEMTHRLQPISGVAAVTAA
jgi:hypothetical protein